ncbi:MAG: hypothetical protein AB1405_01600 [Bdellovibrionota bacterium]
MFVRTLASHLVPFSFAFFLYFLCSAPAVAAGPVTREFDKNGDGKADKWAVFEGEWPTEIRYDTNRDGKPDQWEFLKEGRIAEVQEDKNFDTKPDQIVVYKGGRPSFKKVDDNMDGHFDRLVFYDGTENIQNTSPEMVRLLAEQAGEAPPKKAIPVANPGPPLPKEAPGKSDIPGALVPPSPPASTASATDYFDLGEPSLRVPLLGGLLANTDWQIERNRQKFQGLGPQRRFEIQHKPTEGVLWVERRPQDETETLPVALESFASAFTRKVLASGRGERKFHTPFGRGEKRIYHASRKGHPMRAALYVLAGGRDLVYVQASAPAETFGRFEKLIDAVVFGIRVEPPAVALP